MIDRLGHVTIFVRNYDDAIKFYTECLGFELTNDENYGNGYRWVTVAPQKQNATAIVFVKADTERKSLRVGNHASDHVFLTMFTDDCHRDYEVMKDRGVKFYGEPHEEPYGLEVVFEDLYGNVLALIEPKQ